MLKIEMEPAKRGQKARAQWQARLVADNGEEIARLSETYNNPEDVAGALQLLAAELAPAYDRWVADMQSLRDAQELHDSRARAEEADRG